VHFIGLLSDCFAARIAEGAEAGHEAPGCFQPVTAEGVAQKILEAIESKEAEVFAHDWMKPGSKPLSIFYRLSR
jgi:hypothetical protein